MSGIDRVQQGSCRLQGPYRLFFHRHEDIDPAAPCLPPGPQPGWSCWRRTQRTRLINWLLDWWENGGLWDTHPSEKWGNKRWMEMLRLQLRKSTSVSRLYLAIFRFVWVWVGVSECVHSLYWIQCELCQSVHHSNIFATRAKKILPTVCVCVRVRACLLVSWCKDFHWALTCLCSPYLWMAGWCLKHCLLQKTFKEETFERCVLL